MQENPLKAQNVKNMLRVVAGYKLHEKWPYLKISLTSIMNSKEKNSHDKGGFHGEKKRKVRNFSHNNKRKEVIREKKSKQI
jgi:hypothetical protein